MAKITSETDMLSALIELADKAESLDERKTMASPLLIGAAIAHARSNGLSVDQVLAMIGDANVRWTPELAFRYSQARSGPKGTT